MSVALRVESFETVAVHDPWTPLARRAAGLVNQTYTFEAEDYTGG